ncbi:MAG: peptidoglycan DD-metalloendopeptidase family protein [Chitinophagales bacterium]
MKTKGFALVLLAALSLTLFSGHAMAWVSQDSFQPSVTAISRESLTRVYQVRQGDTIWAIAKKSNADVNTLLSINRLSDKSIIYEGQYLDIPFSREKMHRIKAGENLWKIAKMYQTSVGRLTAVNPDIKNIDCLNVGQVIKIPASANLRSAVNREYPSRSLKAIFSWPVLGVISSSYGYRKSGFHHGMDIAVPISTPIKAAASGTVIFAGVRSKVYGRTVIIQHPNGTKTLYAHAKKVLVKKGQLVDKGESIALVGVSGRTTGPHVHFEVYRSGNTVDPARYLK